LREKIKKIDFALFRLTAGEKVKVEFKEKELEKEKIEIEKPKIKEQEFEEKIEIQRRLEEARKRIEALKRATEEKTEPERIEPKEKVLEKRVLPKKPETFKRPLIFQKTQPPPEKSFEISQPLPKRPSEKKKYLVRALILIFILTTLALMTSFWYWNLRKKQTPPTTIQEKQVLVEKEIEKPEKEPEKPKIVIPPPLLPLEKTRTLEITDKEEIPSRLTFILKEKLPEDQLTRILIKDKVQNKILGLEDFFEALNIKTPENFFENLEDNFTLFLHSTKEKSYLGFVAKIAKRDDTSTKENLSNLLKSWESSMEDDFNQLFLLFEKQEKAKTHFKEATYKKVSFRYLSFPQKDLGICWAIFDDLFLFTCSGKSMMKVIDILQLQQNL